MKTMRKMMVGASVGALALVALGGINAEAATITSSKTITGIGQGESVSFDAVKVKKGEATYNASAKWDLYETANSTADLSNLKTAKESYITVKTTSATDIYKVLADTQKKYKASCNGTTISITVDKKDVTDMTKYQWRTANSSSWTDFTASGLDLSPYTMQGATIYIRYKGATSINPAANTTKAETIDIGTTTPVTVKEIPADSFVSAEFKVKVPKKANAPAISVDYVNGVIKANKKAVYKVGTSAAVSTALTQTSWSSTMTENYTIDNSKAGCFIMQIPANEKKAASKISFFTWDAATAPTVNYNAASVTTSAKTGDIISGTTGKLSYTAVDNANVDKATFKISTTDTANTYEIFKAKADGTPDGKAIATLKPGAKEVVLTPKKVSKDTELIIRIAGDKKAAKLPSPFATGKVKPVYLETPAS